MRIYLIGEMESTKTVLAMEQNPGAKVEIERVVTPS